MPSTERIVIPYNPRRWARQFHASYKRWAVLVMHRRAGKTTAVPNHHQRAALDDGWERKRLLHLRPDLSDRELRELVHPPGGRHYGHVMPARNQAKFVVWDKIKEYARVVPGVKFNESELLVRYQSGNKLQLFGADDPDALRGLAFSGLSFDEFSQQPANIFSEVLSKSLADHLGYAIFLGTLKGKDHLYKTYEAAKESPDWFALWQDIDASLASEEGITIRLLEIAMEDDRKLIAQGLMTQDEFDQEWYLSVDAAIQGAWYRKEMQAAKAEGRITRVPYEPGLPVDTDWDLGLSDQMSIWFSQSLRSGEVRLIDYYENNGEGFQHYIKVMSEKPYVYGTHHAPWDISIGEMSLGGKSRKQNAAALGLKFEDPLPMTKSVTEDIDVCRAFLSKCWFDGEKCAVGIEGLRHYRKTFNRGMQEYTATPVHDRYSHPADAFRTLAKRWQLPRKKREQAASEVRYADTGQSGGWQAI